MLSSPLFAADSDTTSGTNCYAVTVKMHEGGTFTVNVGSEPVKIKIDCAEGKTISAIKLGETDITSLLNEDGIIIINDPDNEATAITADATITVTF